MSDTQHAVGQAELLGPNPAVEQHPRTKWSYVFRGALLLATAISLYLLAPALLSVFSSWPELRHLQPAWLAGALLFEAFSFVSLWELQRIALRTPSWFAVGTAQLAGNSMGSLIPGGGATASAFSYRMLVRAGIDSGSVASGMTASFFATTSAIFALPILARPCAARRARRAARPRPDGVDRRDRIRRDRAGRVGRARMGPTAPDGRPGGAAAALAHAASGTPSATCRSA